MQTYNKIDCIFARDLEGSKKLLDGQYRNPTVQFLKDVDWTWTEKVDGCLRSNTKLFTTDGKQLNIKDIVDNKLSVEIYGYKDGKIIPTKVIGWHDNGQTSEWYKIKINRRGLGTKGGNYYKTIECTANHKFFIDGQYVRADELVVGQKVTFMREKQDLTYNQRQILIGMLIGDGGVSDNGRSVSFCQEAAHEDYINYISDSIGNISGNKDSSVHVSGYGSNMIRWRTISCNAIEDITKDFIDEGKKIIPKDIVLSPLALAIIYMDDGSLCKNEGQLDRCTIALNDYDENSVNNFIDIINNSYGLNPQKLYSKGWNIRFNAQDAEAFQLIIAPYICDCMQYKLSDKYKGKFIGTIPNSNYESIYTPFQMEILEIEKNIDKPHNRYDITTETHNYFANGILVHNCNIRVHWDGHKVEFGGRTNNASIPAHLMNKLIELFGSTPAEEMFEQLFGERDVILFGEGYGTKIQKGGGKYITNDCNFILFDVMINGNYQERQWVESTAQSFGIQVVPIVGHGPLADAVEYVKAHPCSIIAQEEREMEGIVCRPIYELLDRTGNRVIVKIKWEDMKDLII